jgi:electron transfer flavoprotein beta subunit
MFRIGCLVKPVPDTAEAVYDSREHVLIRNRGPQLINPDDATALSIALEYARTRPGVTVETVTMAPRSAVAHLEDLIRRGADRALLICDPLFAGSDTYVTSRILARCLKPRRYSLILSGTSTLDGGTAHVPAQIAHMLSLPHLSSVSALTIKEKTVEAQIRTDAEILTFEVDLPALLGIAYSADQRLPYIPFEAVTRDVSGSVEIISSRELGFSAEETGSRGSLTRVAWAREYRCTRQDIMQVSSDEEGVRSVLRFLSEKGFLCP